MNLAASIPRQVEYAGRSATREIEMATVINVANEAQLRAAIFQASNDFAVDGVINGGPYTINLTANITLTQSLPMIRGAVPGNSGAEITFNGNGHTIDANSAGRVFFVVSGAVAINDVTIANARAEGGNGGNGDGNGVGGGGGGGLGAGAAVFVNSGAIVTLTNVTAHNAASVGGDGGDPGGTTANSGGGGGGGLGGDGGNGSAVGGGGGGGYEGQRQRSRRAGIKRRRAAAAAANLALEGSRGYLVDRRRRRRWRRTDGRWRRRCWLSPVHGGEGGGATANGADGGMLHVGAGGSAEGGDGGNPNVDGARQQRRQRRRLGGGGGGGAGRS